jgi:hypothetical protein
VSGTIIRCEQEIGGFKSDLGSATYNATAHQFLRIRHLSGNAVCETAPNNAGSPGTYVSLGSASWNTTAVQLSAVKFELKGGTSAAIGSTPTAVFDNFRAAKP